MTTWFTPASARDEIERIRRRVERLSHLHRSLEGRLPPGGLGERPVPDDYFRALQQYARLCAAVERHGARVDCARRGRVVLPAQRAGRPVWLIWRLGQRAPLYWCEWSEKRPATRPIDSEGPWDPAA